MHKLLNSAKEAVTIDELALDKECISLPSLYLRYANLAADMKVNVDEAKSSLEKVQAEVAGRVRQNPEDYGIFKVTESVISAAILSEEDYRVALEDYHEAKREYEKANAVVWALEHKKRALTLLVDLHGSSYHSNPKVSNKGRDAYRSTRQKGKDI